MHNPRLLMVRFPGRVNDASMSMRNAAHQMKPVRRAGYSRAAGRFGGARRQSGFSLVELIVVAAIIGILMAISLPAYKEYIIRANKSAAKAVLMDVASRQEQYLMKSGKNTCSDPADPTDSNQTPTCTYVVPSDGRLAALAYTVPTEVIQNFDITLTAGTNSGSTVAALQGLPIFTVSASGKAGTVQEGHPVATSPLSINQFGLKLPVHEW